jgi:hypothetical protein
MSLAPDYEGLLKLLPRLRQFPDATGQTSLVAAEATEIRSLGFWAEAGPWRVPALPPELTRDTMFESLSADWGAPRTDSQPLPDTDSRRDCITPTGEDPEVPAQKMPALLGHACREHPRTNAPIVSSRQSPEADQKLVEKCASKIEAAAQAAGGEIDRRRLQQKLWRYKARIFHHALTYLAQRGRITLHGI